MHVLCSRACLCLFTFLATTGRRARRPQQTRRLCVARIDFCLASRRASRANAPPRTVCLDAIRRNRTATPGSIDAWPSSQSKANFEQFRFRAKSSSRVRALFLNAFRFFVCFAVTDVTQWVFLKIAQHQLRRHARIKCVGWLLNEQIASLPIAAN